MKISEVIAKLSTMAEKYGDVEMFVEPNIDEAWWVEEFDLDCLGARKNGLTTGKDQMVRYEHDPEHVDCVVISLFS